MLTRSRLWISTLVLSFVTSIFAEEAGANATRVLSGEHEYGEKYTVVYVAPEASDEARDDEEFDRYRYRNSWLQWDQAVTRTTSVSLRAQRIDRDYLDRPTLDNRTTHAQLRLTLEPAVGWAIWPRVSIRQRDYAHRNLDNLIVTSGFEARYRWGVRHSIRFGASWTGSRYDIESFRDREQTSVFAVFERPVTERLTLRVSGRAEAVDFASPAPMRENSTRGSGAVGFRLEL